MCIAVFGCFGGPVLGIRKDGMVDDGHGIMVHDGVWVGFGCCAGISTSILSTVYC